MHDPDGLPSRSKGSTAVRVVHLGHLYFFKVIIAGDFIHHLPSLGRPTWRTGMWTPDLHFRPPILLSCVIHDFVPKKTVLEYSIADISR
ncbi:unnamed protein product [Sphacelaria rigidula]